MDRFDKDGLPTQESVNAHLGRICGRKVTAYLVDIPTGTEGGGRQFPHDGPDGGTLARLRQGSIPPKIGGQALEMAGATY